MRPPSTDDIRRELSRSYGHVVGSWRRRRIGLANALYRVAALLPARALRRWIRKFMSILKIEDGVLKSYDRMSGVYNVENERLLSDTTVVLCKYNQQYALRESGTIYREQIAYLADNVFRPILRDGMTVLEVGAGECTTIQNLMTHLSPLDVRWSALELSWSRIAEGKRWALSNGTLDSFDVLVAGSAINLPFEDNSFDVVFTNGCLEQIRYGTEQAISEILRVSNHLVVLYEPSYELGDRYQRLYMEGSQYCRGIPAILGKLGAKPLRHELAPHSFNPFCCYAVTICKKRSSETRGNSGKKAKLCCPQCKSPLAPVADGLYCASFECSCVYPALWGIPCLRKENAIFASKYREMVVSQVPAQPVHAQSVSLDP